MKKLLLLMAMAIAGQLAQAARVPVDEQTNELSAKVRMENMVRTLSAKEFQQVTGKKFSRLQQWQYKRLQKKLNSRHSAFIPERDELTEGFQALPFFGSLLTLGIVYLIMLFTARDRNALRWAGYGITVAALALSIMLLIGSVSGY